MSTGDNSKSERSCCISHEFSRAASENPNKVALIHSSGRAQLSRKFHALTAALPATSAGDDIPQSSSSLPSPLLYLGDCYFTYSQLLAAVESLASRLRSLLVRTPETRVFGIYIPPSADYVAAVLAVIRCGGVFLPLDPSWPKARVLSIIASSNVDLVIASKYPFGAESESEWIAESGNFRVLWFSLVEEEEEQEGNGESRYLDWPCEDREQRSFCYVMYTSGSTGKPKGVCGTEQGLLNRFLWMQELYPLIGEELLLFKTSISFVDHLQEFLTAVLTACTLVIPPSNELKQNVFSIVDYIQAYSIDRLTAVPSLMRAIIPTLESRQGIDRVVLSSLKLLVLSGETLPLSLWDSLSKILPGASILNLYGSTEVSGDCTYFDCKRLPMILESETLTSVPIGIPIANCDVVLVDDDDLANYGEIYVSGVCNSIGYYSDSAFMSLDQVKLARDYANCGSANGHEDNLYIRTGDFAKRLQGGDLVFLGRKDRTIKLNGQRMALEEIEDVLRGHPDVIDAAVISYKVQDEISLQGAFLILEKERSNGVSRVHIKRWMLDKLPLSMVPNCFINAEAFPMTSSGKVDYESLTSEFLAKRFQNDIEDVGNVNLLQHIKKVFCEVLMVEEVSDDDDFFMLGGNSIAAAHFSNNLGIDMRLLYHFPSPSKLCTNLLERNTTLDNWRMNLKEGRRNLLHAVRSRASYSSNNESGLKLLRTPSENTENHAVTHKRLKLDAKVNVTPEGFTLVNGYPWNAASMCFSCSFSKCNNFIQKSEDRMNGVHQENCVEVPRSRKVSMQEFWQVHLRSCVDASPLIVCNGPDIHLFIGSHSHEFLCVNARSGHVRWKIQLEGRIECSATILGDFSQVVVGCYKGKLYFIDSSNGSIYWTFQTSSEVKSQPVVDTRNQLIWCGSHDHNLYALDYMNHCCVYKVPCGGSIFGSPVIDEVKCALYVASTSGRITAISIKALPFNIMWLRELEVPVFGSLAISYLTRNIICCLVDGHVLALHPSGSIIWKYKISGPIFAGACLSSALPFQVLICSRDGCVYSFGQEKGNLLWKYSVGDPITASAFVDEHLCLANGPSLSSDRLVCICSSSGRIILLQVNMDCTSEVDVEEFSRLDLQGDVFSSPVMIGGRIFVGCRDDYVHCLAVNV